MERVVACKGTEVIQRQGQLGWISKAAAASGSISSGALLPRSTQNKALKSEEREEKAGRKISTDPDLLCHLSVNQDARPKINPKVLLVRLALLSIQPETMTQS